MISRPIDPKRRERLSGVHARTQRRTAGSLTFLGFLVGLSVAASYPIASVVAVGFVGGALWCGRRMVRRIGRRSFLPSSRGSVGSDPSMIEE